MHGEGGGGRILLANQEIPLHSELGFGFPTRIKNSGHFNQDVDAISSGKLSDPRIKQTYLHELI